MTGCLPPKPNDREQEFNMEPLTSTIISKEDEANMNDDSPNKTIKTTFNSNYLCLSLFLTLSIVNLIMGFLSIQYSIFDIIMQERIKMRPGFPPMEYWRSPKVKVLVKTYIYAVENSIEFEKGYDKKLKIKEIGPIVYEQILTQEDIRFEKNSTLSYTTIRKFRYVEELNEPGIMNKSIIVVNPLFLPIASVMNEMPWSVLLAFDDPFLNRTVHQVLWDCSSKILDVSIKLMPLLVPSNNCGILHQTFMPRPERYNVKIGSEHGYENFWKINTINNKKTLGYYKKSQYSQCPSFSAVGSTDGTGYRPYMKQDTIKIATARIPRSFNLDFDGYVTKGRLHAHKYTFSKSNLIHANDSTRDCLRKSGQFELPDGLIDASTLAYDMPIAISNPHFYEFNGEWENYIEGLTPNQEDHSSYIIIEPKTGIPLTAKASLQTNLVVPEIKYITKLKKFSNKIIPTFWIQQELLRNEKEFEIELLVNFLPIIQIISTILFYVLSALFTVKFILKYNQFRKEIKNLSKNISINRAKSFQSIILDRHEKIPIV